LGVLLLREKKGGKERRIEKKREGGLRGKKKRRWRDGQVRERRGRRGPQLKFLATSLSEHYCS